MAGSTHHHSKLEDAEEQVDHLLGSESEHEPGTASARRSLFSVTLVWAGFPMIITGAMTGSILVLGMGFSRALTAMIIGNVIMLGYVGALGILGTRGGVNFALLASVVFGRKGYVLASGLPSTLLLGWYGVHTGITGALVSSTCGLNYVLMTVIAGLLYIDITFIGVRGLHYIGLVSIRVCMSVDLCLRDGCPARNAVNIRQSAAKVATTARYMPCRKGVMNTTKTLLRPPACLPDLFVSSKGLSIQFLGLAWGSK